MQNNTVLLFYINVSTDIVDGTKLPLCYK